MKAWNQMTRRFIPGIPLITIVSIASSGFLVTPRPASATYVPWLQNGPGGAAADKSQAAIVYLVRHAEKADDGTEDPPLTLAGQIRVQTLRALMADAGLTDVYTTDWKRTQQTARPIAEDAGLVPRVYEPDDLEDLAATIGARPGRYFVAGHSNTTPQLVGALGGDPQGSIDEMEYDRLYILVIQPGQEVVTALLRFGEPFVEGSDFALRSGRAVALDKGSGTDLQLLCRTTAVSVRPISTSSKGTGSCRDAAGLHRRPTGSSAPSQADHQRDGQNAVQLAAPDQYRPGCCPFG